MDKFLEDVLKTYASEEVSQVYAYDGETGTLSPNIVFVSISDEMTDIDKFIRLYGVIDVYKKVAVFYNRDTQETIEIPIKGFKKEGRNSLDYLKTSFSSDVSIGTMVECFGAIPNKFLSKEYNENSGETIIKIYLGNYDYSSVDDGNGGKTYKMEKKPLMWCYKIDMLIPVAKTSNGNYFLFDSASDYDTKHTKNFHEYISALQKLNMEALEDVRKTVPDCQFAMMADWRANFLITDKEYTPMFITKYIGILSDDEDKMRLLGIVEKASAKEYYETHAVLMDIYKKSKTFRARILSNICPEARSWGKSKDIPMVVGVDDIGYDYAIIDIDDRYIYLSKMGDFKYKESEWDKISRDKTYALKYDITNGDIIQIKKSKIETDDIYENKKEKKGSNV